MPHKPTIIVSGKDGQLGSELLLLHVSYPEYHWVFLGKNVLDLASEMAVDKVFEEYKPAYFINCAAYTAVDKAEEERSIAKGINTTAVGYIARKCSGSGTTLIHISTDYVFDGEGEEPYKADNITAPVNYYGLTKRDGELLALQYNKKTIILRTAWVYSSYGKNFVKTMLRLMNEKPELSVVNDQLGSPTYARDLAGAIIEIILAEKKHYGIYHFTNEGVISWYDFAVAIQTLSGLHCRVKPIPTSEFKTIAKRPQYSVMNHSKIVSDYHITLKPWRDSLRECLQQMERF